MRVHMLVAVSIPENLLTYVVARKRLTDHHPNIDSTVAATRLGRAA